MKHLFVRILLSLLLAIQFQSCGSLSNDNVSICGIEKKSYLYVNNRDTDIKAKIILFPSGNFVYSETNHDILGTLCQYNKGIWHQEKDTVYLTTFFQNRIDDYILELGDIENKDSVLVYIHSMQTEKPTDDFAFFDKNDSLILPDTEGRIAVPCSEKESLARQLLIGLVDDNDTTVTLECGRKYKCYIKDCFPIVMHEEKFIETDSSLFDMRTGDLYLQEGTIERESAHFPTKSRQMKKNK